VIRGTDKGIWDRIRLIPFNVSIPEDEQDKELANKLMAELPGILAWAVRGCLEWQRVGLGVAEQVRQATDTYRAEMDVLATFLDERCFVAPTASTPASALYGAYRAWCEDAGEHLTSQRAFGLRLKERGFRNERVGRDKIHTWFGVGLPEPSYARFSLDGGPREADSSAPVGNGVTAANSDDWEVV
jgi:putative DNA primase/helicase